MNLALAIVKFDTTIARVTSSSATSITVIALPSRTAEPVDIHVVTRAGSVDLADAFTYTGVLLPVATASVGPLFGPPAPSVSALSPTSGTTNGGTSVIITGSAFTGATSVTFGATNATTYTVNSDTQITATTPAHTGAGAVDVSVTTSGGTGTLTGGYAYTLAAAPTISSISPTPAQPPAARS